MALRRFSLKGAISHIEQLTGDLVKSKKELLEMLRSGQIVASGIRYDHTADWIEAGDPEQEGESVRIPVISWTGGSINCEESTLDEQLPERLNGYYFIGITIGEKDLDDHWKQKQKRASGGGRKTKHEWAQATGAIVDFVRENKGFPVNQARLVEALQKWFEENAERVPDDSVTEDFVKNIYIGANKKR